MRYATHKNALYMGVKVEIRRGKSRHRPVPRIVAQVRNRTPAN